MSGRLTTTSRFGDDRLHSLARFDETVPEPVPTKFRCDYCGETLYVGDNVVMTYENEVVHDDCWRDYCDEIYMDRRGNIDVDGDIT